MIFTEKRMEFPPTGYVYYGQL